MSWQSVQTGTLESSKRSWGARKFRKAKSLVSILIQKLKKAVSQTEINTKQNLGPCSFSGLVKVLATCKGFSTKTTSAWGTLSSAAMRSAPTETWCHVGKLVPLFHEMHCAPLQHSFQASASKDSFPFHSWSLDEPFFVTTFGWT
jgi:hypothetical protein